MSYFTRAEDGSVVEVLTAAEVMAFLEITRTRLYELTASRGLPYHKLTTGHRRRIFYRHELEAWLATFTRAEDGSVVEVLTAAEVMALFSITPKQLYGLTARGGLPCHELPLGPRRWFFYRHEVEAWLATRVVRFGGISGEISDDSVPL